MEQLGANPGMGRPGPMPGGFDEKRFRQWYAGHAKRLDLDPNPDSPLHFYDYRAAYRAGAEPDANSHWPSEFKREGHPRMVVDGVNTKTGKESEYLSTDPDAGEDLVETPPEQYRQPQGFLETYGAMATGESEGLEAQGRAGLTALGIAAPAIGLPLATAAAPVLATKAGMGLTAAALALASGSSVKSAAAQSVAAGLGIPWAANTTLGRKILQGVARKLLGAEAAAAPAAAVGGPSATMARLPITGAAEEVAAAPALAAESFGARIGATRPTPSIPWRPPVGKAVPSGLAETAQTASAEPVAGQVARDWIAKYNGSDAAGRQALVRGLGGKLNYEDMRQLAAVSVESRGSPAAYFHKVAPNAAAPPPVAPKPAAPKPLAETARKVAAKAKAKPAVAASLKGTEKTRPAEALVNDLVRKWEALPDAASRLEFKANLAKLGIPGVKNIGDLKKLAGWQPSTTTKAQRAQFEVPE